MDEKMSTLEITLASIFVLWNLAGGLIFPEFYTGYCSYQSKKWKIYLISLACGPSSTIGFFITDSRFHMMALLNRLGHWTEK